METRYISLNDAIDMAKFYEAECDPIPRLIDSLKAIEPADVVPAPRWIPVEERLPELCQNVLVHYNNLHCVEPHNYAVAYRQNGLDEFIPGNHIWHVDSSPLELNGSDVTHWMPLPQPPEEWGGENE